MKNNFTSMLSSHSPRVLF